VREGGRDLHTLKRGESESMIRTSLTLPRGSPRSIDGERRERGGTRCHYLSTRVILFYNINQLIDATAINNDTLTKSDGRSALVDRRREKRSYEDPEKTGVSCEPPSRTSRGSVARKGDENCASGTQSRRMAQSICLLRGGAMYMVEIRQGRIANGWMQRRN